MVSNAEQVDDDSNRDQRRAEPERKSVFPRRKVGLPHTQRLQEQTEAGDDKAEPHQRQTGANPH
jgi:hypothetical protein